MAVQKYLLFLRFRNSERFEKLLHSAKISHTFMQQAQTRTRYNPRTHSVNPLQNEPFFDWKSLLVGFTVFLEGTYDNHKDVAFICNCIHTHYDRLVSAELCVGVSLDPDQYIMSASCWGAVADEDDDSRSVSITFSP